MATQPKFEPILPAHAIERCAATIIFDKPIAGDLVRNAIDHSRRQFPAWERLKSGPGPGTASFAVTFDAKTGKVSLGTPDGIFNFALPDSASDLSVMPNIVTWQTGKYVRWRPFLGDLKAFAMPVVQSLLAHAAINAVKLEYWDRFVWSGPASEFDPSLLLRPGLQLVAPAVVSKGRYWHNHCGWFEPVSDGCRRLTNVNLDVVDAAVGKNQVARPTIGILTMIQDDYSTGAHQMLTSVDEIQSKFDVLHQALKTLLSSIISKEMAERISLQSVEI